LGNACRRQGNAAKRGCEPEPEPEPGPGPKASQIVYMKWHPILELRCYHYPVAAFFSSIEKLSNFKFRSRNQVSLPIAPHCRIAVVLIEIQRRPTTPQVPAISRAVQSSRASTLPRSSHDPSGTPSSRPSGPQPVYRLPVPVPDPTCKIFLSKQASKSKPFTVYRSTSILKSKSVTAFNSECLACFLPKTA